MKNGQITLCTDEVLLETAGLMEVHMPVKISMISL